MKDNYRKEITSDLEFCQELADRLIDLSKDKNKFGKYQGTTVMKNDIIRLRRELLNIKHKLDWSYRVKFKND